MASSAAEMIFRCVFEASISMRDQEIERRPYHKYCKCALHSMKGTNTSNACPHQRNISFPKKQSWSDDALSMAACNYKFSSQRSLFPQNKPNGECKRRH
ncbi:hypothetical protein L484_007609 [Morus notabilis]|uniref:Uncharacterized protein n=1 Tax=Morus notabilis TaxID=981085 RepID=W9SHE2_9ROSA|nr:hypothetical protein L484_007609 [Morus notabilis]